MTRLDARSLPASAPSWHGGGPRSPRSRSLWVWGGSCLSWSGITTEWPYVVVGIGWALYAVALFGYGSVRSRRVEQAIDRGEMIQSSRTETRLLMIFGVILCLATVGLIAASA